MAYNIEAGNDTLTFKEATSKSGRLGFVEETRKEICAYEIENYWNLGRRRELNGKNTTIYIWYFKRKRYPDGRLIKNKACLCAHGGMQKWGVNIWETYPPVVNWMYVRAMLTLIIIRELYTKSVDFVLAYNQADVKT